MDSQKSSCTIVSLCFVALVSTFQFLCSTVSTSPAVAVHSFLSNTVIFFFLHFSFHSSSITFFSFSLPLSQLAFLPLPTPPNPPLPPPNPFSPRLFSSQGEGREDISEGRGLEPDLLHSKGSQVREMSRTVSQRRVNRH